MKQNRMKRTPQGPCDHTIQGCCFPLRGECRTGNGVAGLALEWVVGSLMFLIFQNSHGLLDVPRIESSKVSQSNRLHPSPLLSRGPECWLYLPRHHFIFPSSARLSSSVCKHGLISPTLSPSIRTPFLWPLCITKSFQAALP